MTWSGIICSTIVVMMVSGCTTERIRREMTLTPQQVLAEVNGRAQAMRTIQGEGTITIESQEGSHTVSFEVYLKKPDSVRVEFQGPFGLQIATLMVTPDSFLLYDRRENIAIKGIPRGESIQSLFKLNLEYEEIMDAFTGNFLVNSQSDSLLKFAIHNGEYVFHYLNGDEVREYEIDGSYFFVSGYRVLDSKGTPRVYSMSQRPWEVNLYSMPSFVRIVFPEERRSITIVYDNIVFNVPVQCSVELPANIQVFAR